MIWKVIESVIHVIARRVETRSVEIPTTLPGTCASMTPSRQGQVRGKCAPHSHSTALRGLRVFGAVQVSNPLLNG